MKGLTVAVMAVCVATVAARTVVLEAEAAFHTDEWCKDHHLGAGAQECIKYSGCCYDGRIGVCHSCDAHSDEWCGTYGNGGVTDCIGYSGCTYDYDQGTEGLCVSNSDPSAIVDEITCEEALKTAEEEGGIAALTYGEGEEDSGGLDDGALITYMPQCTDEGMWEESQYDAASDFKWCVDENGHEIPDTRKLSREFAEALINCDKERKKHAGMQCPNAVTLSTAGGEVMINDNPDVGNCDVTCNTDQDCKGDEWCCYNGCGYSCQSPITPKADCTHLVLDASLSPADQTPVANQHGVKVTLTCSEGYFGAAPMEIECKHGSWTKFDMECLKDCDPYRVPPPARQRDYEITGRGLHHGETRKVFCAKGYGAVEGSPDAMRFYKETVECINGAWTEQSLVCSTCYDADSVGPHAWWTGIDQGSARGESFDCTYFASRPMACADYPEARENCRVSCRTCEEALMEYKVKAIREDKDGVKHPDKWLKKKLIVKKGFQPTVVSQRRIKVPARVKKV